MFVDESVDAQCCHLGQGCTGESVSLDTVCLRRQRGSTRGTYLSTLQRLLSTLKDKTACTVLPKREREGEA